MNDLRVGVSKAVRHFWKTRKNQESKQGQRTGKRDHGNRSAVTCGAQMNGFVQLVRNLLIEYGLPPETIFERRQQTELPGFFRPTKSWDLVVVAEGQLLVSIEFKSQIGPSFGNNYNNRTEEALGNATDIWTAFREGAFQDSPRPLLCYLMLLEESPQSTRPVSVSEPHFPVFPDFREASYAKRYEVLCQRLVRERLYDVACLILANAKDGAAGRYREPSGELSFTQLASALAGKVEAYRRLKSENA
jgi:hypothetical protein